MDTQTRILVTGSNGFIGRPTKERLSESFQLVDVWTAEGDVQRIDLADGAKVRHRIEELRPQIIVHLAGKRRYETSPNELFDLHVTGTANLLEAALPTLQRIIVLGSAAEYGLRADTQPILESDACTPANDYGHSKLAQSNLVQQFAERHSVSWHVLRGFNVYGPGQGRGLSMREMLEQIRQAEHTSQPLRIAGGDACRDLVHRGRIAEIIKEAAVGNLPSGIFNACSGQATTIADQARWLAEGFGLSCDLDVSLSDRHLKHSVGSCEKLESHLGSLEHPELPEALRQIGHLFRQATS